MSTDDHPNPDPGGSDDAESEQPKIVVDDPEDFAKTRQLRAIFDARDDYIDARRDANRLCEDGELPFTDRNRRLFRHLQDLAMTIEPLLKSYDAGRKIWEENTYSTDSSFVAADELYSFEAAYEKIKFDVETKTTAEKTRGEELLEDYKKEQNKGFVARRDLDKIKAKMRVMCTTWDWEVQGLGRLIEQTHRLKYCKNARGNEFGTTAPPQEVSDTAFRDIQDFIRQIGLGVQFDTEQQTKIDDDLLEEVDTWRQQNVN